MDGVSGEIANAYVKLRCAGLTEVTLRDVVKCIKRSKDQLATSALLSFQQLVAARYGVISGEAWKDVFGLGRDHCEEGRVYASDKVGKLVRGGFLLASGLFLSLSFPELSAQLFQPRLLRRHGCHRSGVHLSPNASSVNACNMARIKIGS